jgi:hypothetical protein
MDYAIVTTGDKQLLVVAEARRDALAEKLGPLEAVAHLTGKKHHNRLLLSNQVSTSPGHAIHTLFTLHPIHVLGQRSFPLHMLPISRGLVSYTLPRLMDTTTI